MSSISADNESTDHGIDFFCSFVLIYLLGVQKQLCPHFLNGKITFIKFYLFLEI